MPDVCAAARGIGTKVADRGVDICVVEAITPGAVSLVVVVSLTASFMSEQILLLQGLLLLLVVVLLAVGLLAHSTCS